MTDANYHHVPTAAQLPAVLQLRVRRKSIDREILSCCSTPDENLLRLKALSTLKAQR